MCIGWRAHYPFPPKVLLIRGRGWGCAKQHLARLSSSLLRTPLGSISLGSSNKGSGSSVPLIFQKFIEV